MHVRICSLSLTWNDLSHLLSSRWLWQRFVENMTGLVLMLISVAVHAIHWQIFSNNSNQIDANTEDFFKKGDAAP
jgi:amino acid permease